MTSSAAGHTQWGSVTEFLKEADLMGVSVMLLGLASPREAVVKRSEVGCSWVCLRCSQGVAVASFSPG